MTLATLARGSEELSLVARTSPRDLTRRDPLYRRCWPGGKLTPRNGGMIEIRSRTQAPFVKATMFCIAMPPLDRFGVSFRWLLTVWWVN